MTSPFIQPNSQTQTGGAYKNNLDNAAAVFARQAAAFHVQAQAVPDLTVRVLGGAMAAPAGGQDIPVRNSPAFVPPASGSRVDIVALNRFSGGLRIVRGGEKFPYGFVPLAHVSLAAGQTEIVNADILDARLTMASDGRDLCERIGRVPKYRFAAVPEMQPFNLDVVRATPATRVGPRGYLEAVPDNVLRHEYDPLTKEYQGQAISHIASNLIRYSEAFEQWSLSNLIPSISPEKDPFGGNNMRMLTSTANSGTIGGVRDFTVEAGKIYTVSVFMKEGSYAATTIRHNTNNGCFVDTQFRYRQDLDQTANTGTPLRTTVTKLRNGIVRITSSQMAVASGTARAQILAYWSGAYQPAIGSTLNWFGFMVNEGYETSYIKTEENPVIRASDQVFRTIDPITEGAVYFEGVVNSFSSWPNRIIFSLLETAPIGQIRCQINDTNRIGFVATFNGTDRAGNTPNNTLVLGEPFRCAISWGRDPITAQSVLRASVNGQAVTMPAPHDSYTAIEDFYLFGRNVADDKIPSGIFRDAAVDDVVWSESQIFAATAFGG